MVVVGFIRDFIDAMVYLHDVKRIVHRDLKPDNLFVQISLGTAAGTRRPILVVGDVGLAKQVTRTMSLRSAAGAVAYRAPEAMADDASCCTASDVYAASLVAVELVTKRGVYQECQGSRAAKRAMVEEAKAKMASILEFADDSSLTVAASDLLLSACTLEAPESRPSFQVIAEAMRPTGPPGMRIANGGGGGDGDGGGGGGDGAANQAPQVVSAEAQAAAARAAAEAAEAERQFLAERQFVVAHQVNQVLVAVDDLISRRQIVAAERRLRPNVARSPTEATPFALLSRYILLLHSELWVHQKFSDLRRTVFNSFKERARHEHHAFMAQRGAKDGASALEARENFRQMMSKLTLDNGPKPRLDLGDAFKNKRFPPSDDAFIRRMNAFLDAR